jgi:hypothetical protein
VLSKAAMPDLYAYIGDTFAKGDEPAGFFRMPESRAEFFRGWDHGRGVDAGRALGSYQADELKAHDHLTYAENKYSSPASLGSSGAVAPHNAGGTAGIRTGMTGGTETRPRNLAVMWCMKAWNAPINQGQIDIAALAYLSAQASETQQGTAKVATDAQMLDSANDSVVVTPKKLRKGFAISLGSNGYIAFPSWLGGIVFQWGSGTIAPVSDTPVAFPLAFPTACLMALAGAGNTDGSEAEVATRSWSAGNVVLKADTGGSYRYLAVGH